MIQDQTPDGYKSDLSASQEIYVYRQATLALKGEQENFVHLDRLRQNLRALLTSLDKQVAFSRAYKTQLEVDVQKAKIDVTRRQEINQNRAQEQREAMMTVL